MSESKISRRDFNIAASSLLSAASATAEAVTKKTKPISSFFDRADALDIAAAIRRGEYSAEQILEEAIRRTEAVNGKLNAIVIKHYDYAREQLAKGLAQGPLHGVPLLLKDLSDPLEGTVSTGGSKSLVGIKAPKDSPLIARYKRAGLLPFGKTNTPEFGMALTTESLLWGPCRNPWDTSRTTGGSSGGSAAAVAAGIVPVAHATDGGGSIRVPAAACGVFGFKPTRAMTPRPLGNGHSPSGMSISHVVSRTVRDSAFFLDVGAGYEPGAATAAPGSDFGFFQATQKTPRQLRIAINLTEPEVELHPDCRRAVETLGRELEALGHIVEEAAPGLDYGALNKAQSTAMLSEFAIGMAGIAQLHDGKLDERHLEPLSLKFMEQGNAISAGDYIKAVKYCAVLGEQMAQFQRSYDLVLQPVTNNPAVPLGTINEQAGDDVEPFVTRFKRLYSPYTHLYNMTGQPAATVPVLISDSGLPVCAMVAGRNGEDDLLFSVCAQIERARPWFDWQPPITAIGS